jgi:hypothetical protein
MDFLLIDWLGRCARFADHLAVRNIAQGAQLGGGSTLYPKSMQGKKQEHHYACGFKKLGNKYCALTLEKNQ